VALAAGLVVVLGVAGWLLWRNWVPSAPGAPSSQAVTATSVELRWSPSTSGPSVEQYLIERNGTQVASVAASVTTWRDQGVMPNSSYRYVVIGAAGSKRSAPSAEVVVRTLPTMPEGLEQTASSATSVTIGWSAPSRGPAPEQYVVTRDGAEVESVPGTQTSYEDLGLEPGGVYSYVVTAVTGAGRSQPSAELIAVTLPGAPTGLKAAAVTTSTVTLQWSRPAAGPAPDSYVVLRDDTEVATVPGSTTSWTDRGRAPATTYAYTVQSVTDTLRSDPTPALSVTTRTPAVASGHLDGSWPVDGKVTKVSGTVTLGGSAAKGQTFGWTWDFASSCKTGACPAVVSGYFASHPFTVKLTPRTAPTRARPSRTSRTARAWAAPSTSRTPSGSTARSPRPRSRRASGPSPRGRAR
jgi:chitodextrinase